MAAAPIKIYVDKGMKMYLDPMKTTTFSGLLYQRPGDPLSYFMDEAQSVEVQLVELDESSVLVDSESCSSPSLGVFSRGHTLFLIDLMRQHLMEGGSLPRNLEELKARLRKIKGQKKLLWQEAAEKLETRFNVSFCPDRVARKWVTLVDGYRNVKERNRSPGTGKMRFRYYKEMDELMDAEQDIVFPVVGTFKGLDVRRPEELGQNNASVDPASDPQSCPSMSALATAEVFSRDHTLFLIDLMRQHLMNGDSLPRSLEELTARLKTRKGQKKLLWQEAAEKLETRFNVSFCPDRVARKWVTLVDGYRNVKDRNGSLGKRKMRFRYYQEMDELMAKQQDIAFPAVETFTDGDTCRLEELRQNNKSTLTDTESNPPMHKRKRLLSPSATNTRKRKEGDDDDSVVEDLVEMFRQSEAASQRRHEEMLEQLKSAQADFKAAQQSFESFMTQLLKKL